MKLGKNSKTKFSKFSVLIFLASSILLGVITLNLAEADGLSKSSCLFGLSNREKIASNKNEKSRTLGACLNYFAPEGTVIRDRYNSLQSFCDFVYNTSEFRNEKTSQAALDWKVQKKFDCRLDAVAYVIHLLKSE